MYIFQYTVRHAGLLTGKKDVKISLRRSSLILFGYLPQCTDPPQSWPAFTLLCIHSSCFLTMFIFWGQFQVENSWHPFTYLSVLLVSKILSMDAQGLDLAKSATQHSVFTFLSVARLICFRFCESISMFSFGWVCSAALMSCISEFLKIQSESNFEFPLTAWRKPQFLAFLVPSFTPNSHQTLR